jgi:quinol monooxygenase YgiN
MSQAGSKDPFVVLIEFQTSAEEQEMLADLAADRAEAKLRHRPGFLWTRILRDEDGTGFWWMTGWKDREAYMTALRDKETQEIYQQIIREEMRPRTTYLKVHTAIGAV